MSTTPEDVYGSPAGRIPSQLQRQTFEPRALKSGLLTALAWVMTLIAGIPLLSVLYMLVVLKVVRGWISRH